MSFKVKRKVFYAKIKMLAKQLWGDDFDELLQDLVRAYYGKRALKEGRYSLTRVPDEGLVKIADRLRDLLGLCTDRQQWKIKQEMKRLGWKWEDLSQWIERQVGQAKRSDMLNKREATKVITGMYHLRLDNHQGAKRQACAKG